jgi:hypothetical protein
MTLQRELLVDTARILGSLPIPVLDRVDTPPDLSTAQWDTLVGVALEAAGARIGHAPQMPVLTVTYSPWYSQFKGGRDPYNTTGEAAEMAAWEAGLYSVRAALANASKRAAASSVATIGAVMLDSESFGWCWRYQHQAQGDMKAAVRRKNELVYNTTKRVFPGAEVIFYSYGEPWYYPFNIKTTCCTNLDGKIPVPGWCTEKHGTYTESFSKDVPVTLSMYEVYEPEFTRQKFIYAAMNAAALNGTGTVMPYVALGAGSRPSLATGTLRERSLGVPESFQCGESL